VTAVAAPEVGRPSRAVIDWLADPHYPAVRRLTFMRLHRRRSHDPEVRELDERLGDDPWVARLLAGEWRTGTGGRVRVHAYKKWGGAHWRLVALAELGVTTATHGAGDALAEAFEQTAGWLTGPGHARSARPIDGRVRACASKEGNAIWAACRIGLGRHPGVASMVSHLLDWQWPDGGWNCDVRPAARHSSFNESWAPLRGLLAYRSVASPRAAVSALDHAIDRAADFFLRHQVVESERTGAIAHPSLTLLRWPPYWHYGLLPGLRVLHEAGRLGEPAAAAAVTRLQAMRRADGTWRPDGRWWRRPGTGGSNVEILDWGAEGEARMLTLLAAEVLAAAGERG